MNSADLWAIWAPWILLAIRILTVGCCAMIVWEIVGMIRLIVRIIRKKEK